MAFNVTLANRLATKCENMASFAYAYNHAKGVRPYSVGYLYRLVSENGVQVHFVRKSKVRKIRASTTDLIMSGVSVGRRLYAYEKPEIRQFLGGKCVCCGTERGLEIDHIDGNCHNTQIGNLQLLCGTCHNEKTESQAYLYRKTA